MSQTHEGPGEASTGRDRVPTVVAPAAPANPAPAVELRDVSFAYGAHCVLEGVGLSFYAGQVSAVLGPNGCGKSTTVKLVNRALVPARGQVLLDGADVAGMGRKEVARRVAVLAQGVQAPSMRVGQFVLCGRYPHRAALVAPSAHDREVVRQAMERAGCADHADDDMARLSGGERQRAMLAAVLAQQARVVLMDEPTTYLDPTACFDLMGMARDLACEGAAVVMVLHDVPLALSFCDRVAVLAQGRVQACGAPEDVARSGVIDRVFGVRLRRLPPDPADPSARPGYCLAPREG